MEENTWPETLYILDVYASHGKQEQKNNGDLSAPTTPPHFGMLFV